MIHNIRAEYLRAQGIKVIRFWNNDVVENIEGVLYEIKERGNSPTRAQHGYPAS